MSGAPSPGLMVVALVLGGLVLLRMTALGASCARARGEGDRVLGWVVCVWLCALGAMAFAGLALYLWQWDFWQSLERSKTGQESPAVVWSGFAGALVAFGLLFRLLRLLKWGIGEPPTPDELARSDRETEERPARKDDADEASSEEERFER